MYFDSLSAVFTMDGHGPYVWSAYAISLLVLALLLLTPGRRQRRLLRELQGEARRRNISAGPDGSGPDTVAPHKEVS